jgi:prolyl-tRNA editing enzyme YbaK/EbsC (Cys-tRNA(Pro) deacylase)
VRIGPFPNPDTVCPYQTDTFLSQKKYAESVGQHKIEVIIDEALIRGDTRIAVGGGAPSVKITGATSVFVKFTDAAVASVTTSSVN